MNLNLHTPDVQSDITGHGRHKRLIVSGELDGSAVTATCDLDLPHLAHLPIPTWEQARKCANGSYRVHDNGVRLIASGEPEAWVNPNNGHRMLDFRFSCVAPKKRRIPL